MIARREEILKTGVRLMRDGPQKVTARAIAETVGCNHATVHYYFPTIEMLHDAIAHHAVKMQDSRVIVQLIGTMHPAVKYMRDSDRIRHVKAVREVS